MTHSIISVFKRIKVTTLLIKKQMIFLYYVSLFRGFVLTIQLESYFRTSSYHDGFIGHHFYLSAELITM